VEPGQVVSPGGGALFRIAAGGQLELRAEVAEQDMVRLAVGQPARVTPVGSDASYAGTIWLLEPVIDPQSRQGVARIALPQASALRAGGFANVVIDGVEAARPRVPQSAVMADGGTSYVLVVGQDGVVARRDIRIASIAADGVAVAEGLTGDEQVVVAAGAFLRPGETVKPVRQDPTAPALAPAQAG
jgi:RND family efflux transporter MFP subunit